MAGYLDSWNDTRVKQALIDFVERVTKEDGRDYIPPAERIAVFDNDGTLWTEQPFPVQGFFAMDRLGILAEMKSELKTTQPYKAFLERDHKTLATFGKQELMEIMFTSHDGRTPEDFAKHAAGWYASAVHPLRKTPYNECLFKPQIELLEYLRVKGFKTYIVSGGGQDFMRVISEEYYGVPPEQVIGSTVKTKIEMDGLFPDVVRLPELNTFDDRDVKVLNIHLHIGRRPVFAFGNSDGDLRMMQYTMSGNGPSMAMLIHHDDAAREVAYDKDFNVSPLNEALEIAKEVGITVVSMKNDWKEVF